MTPTQPNPITTPASPPGAQAPPSLVADAAPAPVSPSRPRNHLTVFSTAMGGAARATPSPRPVGASDALADFIDVCDTAIDLAVDGPGAPVLLPGVHVAHEASVLKAYLLFLATEGCRDGRDIPSETFAQWYQRVSHEVWPLLGFGGRPPAKMKLALAFSLICQPEHQAREMRALIWVIGDLAACKLLVGLRA